MTGTTQIPPGGHREVDDSASTFSFIGIAAAIILAFLMFLARSNGIVMAILGLFFIGALAVAAWSIREMRRWNPIEVVFSEWPLTLGSSQQLHVHRVAKTSVPDGTIAITGELTCTEKAIYKVGTETRTDTATPALLPVSGMGPLTQGRFDGTIELTVPLDRGAPTMDLTHNEITWELKLELTNPNGADKRMSFRIPVVAELARPHQNIQDAPPEASR